MGGGGDKIVYERPVIVTSRSFRTALVAAGSLALAACASIPLPAALRRGPEFWGFVVPWDARSSAAAQSHAPQLDVAIAHWLVLDTIPGGLLESGADSVVARSAPGTTGPSSFVHAGKFSASIMQPTLSIRHSRATGPTPTLP